MKQIRNGVFETNSSSMHSLVVKKKSEYYTKDEVEMCFFIGSDGLQHVYSGDLEFGRFPFRVLTTLREKALYTLASMCCTKNDEVYDEVYETIRFYIPDFIGFDFELECDTYRKKYANEEKIKSLYGENNYSEMDDNWIVWKYDMGRVDENILSGFLKKENITITEFLKNKRYVVIIDGDEYCIYKTMKKEGLINLNEIESEYTPGDWMGE